jgi:CBS domain-containing protein
MTPDVVYAYDDEDVAEISEGMAAHQIRRLPVVNREHDLVGIVALGDLAVSAADDQNVEQVLEDVSQPARPTRAGTEPDDR